MSHCSGAAHEISIHVCLHFLNSGSIAIWLVENLAADSNDCTCEMEAILLTPQMQRMWAQMQSLEQEKIHREEKVRATAAKTLAVIGFNHEPDIVHKLVAVLTDHNDYWSAIEAAEMLGNSGDHSDTAVNELATYLRDGVNLRVKAACARALGRVKRNVAHAAECLVEMLKFDDEAIRKAVVQGIARLGERANLQIDKILDLLENGNSGTRIAAAQALGAFANTAPTRSIQYLTRALQDTNPNLRKEAAKALGTIGKHTDSELHDMSTVLQDENAIVREAALQALEILRDRAAPFADQIFSLLTDPDWTVRKAAVKTIVSLGDQNLISTTLINNEPDLWIGELGVPSSSTLNRKEDFRISAVGLLTETLKTDQELQVREAAATALGHIAPTTNQEFALGASNELATAARKDINLRVRTAAVQAIGKLGIHAVANIDVLAQAINSGNEEIREAATEAIVSLGKYASGIVEQLDEFLIKGDWWARNAAAEALGGLGSNSHMHEKHINQFMVMLESEKLQIREGGAKALGAMGSLAVPALNILTKKLDDKAPRLRCEALHTLRILGPHAASKSESISKRLEDEDWLVRKAAVRALCSLEEMETEKINRTGDQLTNAEKQIRLATMEAHGEIAELPHSNISKLAHAMSNDERSEVRAAAAESLGALGQRAATMARHICGAIFDESWKVSKAALKALTCIGTTATDEVVPYLQEALITGRTKGITISFNEAPPCKKRKNW